MKLLIIRPGQIKLRFVVTASSEVSFRDHRWRSGLDCVTVEVLGEVLMLKKLIETGELRSHSPGSVSTSCLSVVF